MAYVGTGRDVAMVGKEGEEMWAMGAGKKRVCPSGERRRCQRGGGWLGLGCGEAMPQAALHD